MVESASQQGSLLDDLDARGLVHDCTDRAALDLRLRNGPITLYCGFDPTADSLHLGHLVPLLLLRRFQLAGHRPLALAGGATGMIGDPGGRSDERNLLDAETLAANTEAISLQLRALLDFDPGAAQARLLDNRTWTEPMGVIEFLRDVGKHVTVQQMLVRDAVRSRMDRESGISFTEFSYMLLQANDFYVLHRDHGCELQVAGSDQWGNILSGVDLIRRRTTEVVHGLVAPLITRSDGVKFGKSTSGALWLDPRRTSPFQLHQHLLNLPDDDVEPMLARLTLLDVSECRLVAAEHDLDPARRIGQRRIAAEVVGLVHGAAAVRPVEQAAAILYGSGSGRGSASGSGGGARGTELSIDEDAYRILEHEIPVARVARSTVADGVSAADLLVLDGLGLARSKSEVRRNPRGYSVNGLACDQRDRVTLDDAVHGRYLLLRRGRTAPALVVLEDG